MSNDDGTKSAAKKARKPLPKIKRLENTQAQQHEMGGNNGAGDTLAPVTLGGPGCQPAPTQVFC
jgi:hypothetical protein